MGQGLARTYIRPGQRVVSLGKIEKVPKKNLTGPVYYSNLRISTGTRGIHQVLKNAQIIEAKNFYDGIDIYADLNDRHFKVRLSAYSDDACHISIKELGPGASFKLEDAGVNINRNKMPDSNESPLINQIRISVEELTKAFRLKKLQETKVNTDLLHQPVKTNSGTRTQDGSSRKAYMYKGGVKIHALHSKVGKVLSSTRAKKIHVTKNNAGKEVKVLRPHASLEENQMIKFKLRNPTRDAAELTVLDKLGNKLLADTKITIDRSIRPKKEHKVAYALHNAVADMTLAA